MRNWYGITPLPVRSCSIRNLAERSCVTVETRQFRQSVTQKTPSSKVVERLDEDWHSRPRDPRSSSGHVMAATSCGPFLPAQWLRPRPIADGKATLRRPASVLCFRWAFRSPERFLNSGTYLQTLPFVLTESPTEQIEDMQRGIDKLSGFSAAMRLSQLRGRASAANGIGPPSSSPARKPPRRARPLTRDREKGKRCFRTWLGDGIDANGDEPSETRLSNLRKNT